MVGNGEDLQQRGLTKQCGKTPHLIVAEGRTISSLTKMMAPVQTNSVLKRQSIALSEFTKDIS